MDIKKLIETMSISENLKNYTRHSWTSTLRQESIAEHSWRLSLMAYFISDEFPEADINKIIQMCIFHDMGEAFTGDIPAFNKTDDHEKIESEMLYSWINTLPSPINALCFILLTSIEYSFAKRSITLNPTLCLVFSYLSPGFPNPTIIYKIFASFINC